MVKTFLYCIDGIKGLHTNCRLVRSFESCVLKHLSDYNEIA